MDSLIEGDEQLDWHNSQTTMELCHAFVALFFVFNMNTTAFCLGWCSLHLLLLKSSMLSLSSHSSLFVSFILFSHFFFLYVAFHISLSLAPLSCLWFVQTLFIFLSYYFTLLFSLNPSLLVRFFISSLFWPSISPHFFLSFQPLFILLWFWDDLTVVSFRAHARGRF